MQIHDFHTTLPSEGQLILIWYRNNFYPRSAASDADPLYSVTSPYPVVTRFDKAMYDLEGQEPDDTAYLDEFDEPIDLYYFSAYWAEVPELPASYYADDKPIPEGL
jgi:hypothetical protein